MLGLEGMAVLAVSERDGELEYAIETNAVTGWCPACGAIAQLHGRRPTWVRDLPAGDRPVTLVWVKRIWRCVHPQCEQQTWTETHPAIAPRSSWTERARAQACRRVGRDGHSVAAVAREFGVGWATVMAAVREHGVRLLQRARPGAVARPEAADPTAPLSRVEMRRQIEEDLDPKTTLLVETGDSWLNGTYTRLPGGAKFEIEMQWGSIGWSVPASFG
jgi:transposase-like protein